MSTQDLTTARAAGIRERLARLDRERAAAALTGLDANASYMADLLAELQDARHAYVGAAVTEIALLRAALAGPLNG